MLERRSKAILHRLCGVLCGFLLGALVYFYIDQIVRSSGSYRAPSHSSPKSASRDSRHENEDAARDWLVHDAGGFFTFCLVVVGAAQAGLFLWQLILIRKGLTDTKEAADAARETAKAANESAILAREEFLSTHRPKIRVKHFWLAGDIWQDEPLIVNLTCVNTGTVDALLHEIGIKYFIVRSDRVIPTEPDIPAIHRFFGQRLSSGLNYNIPNMTVGQKFTPDQNSVIQNKTSNLYCVGYISYLDSSTRMRITGFCRKLEFGPNISIIGNSRFSVVEDPDYEYED
jgi:hypothetical protein